MLVSCPELLTFPVTPTTALSRSNSIVTAGLVKSTSPAFSAAMVSGGQRLDVDLESDGKCGLRIDGRDGLVHAKQIRPELFVAERVEAENGLAVQALVRGRHRSESERRMQNEYEHDEERTDRFA